MNIHANATTCPNSRELLAKQGDRAGLELCPGRRSSRGEQEDRRQVGRSAASGRVDGRPLLGPQAGPLEDPGSEGRGDRASSAAADDRGRDRRDPRHRPLDRLALASPDRARQALAPGASRAAQSLRALAAGRADPRRRQEARALQGSRQAGPHHPLPPGGRRLGGASTWPSTTPPAWCTPEYPARRAQGQTTARFLRACPALVP